MAGKRGAPRGNKNAAKKHKMYGARVGGIPGILGVRKLTPEANEYAKSLKKRTGANKVVFTQAGFNNYMNTRKK